MRPRSQYDSLPASLQFEATLSFFTLFPSPLETMAITRSATKGKGRAVSPHVSSSIRAAAGRVSAARASIERAAIGRAINAATSAEDERRPYQDVTNSQSSLTHFVNGAREDGLALHLRRFEGNILLFIYLFLRILMSSPRAACRHAHHHHHHQRHRHHNAL